MSGGTPRTLISDAAVVATAPGWQPGDFIVKPGAGLVTQIGLQGGTRVERPDPVGQLVPINGILKGFSGPVSFADSVAPNEVLISMIVAALDGSLGPAVVRVVVSSVFFVTGAAVQAGATLLGFVPNSVGTNAIIYAKTDAAGVLALTVTGGAAGAAQWQVSTNVDDLGVVSYPFPV